MFVLRIAGRSSKIVNISVQAIRKDEATFRNSEYSMPMWVYSAVSKCVRHGYSYNIDVGKGCFCKGLWVLLSPISILEMRDGWVWIHECNHK
jgi:hypothetical protein